MAVGSRITVGRDGKLWPILYRALKLSPHGQRIGKTKPEDRTSDLRLGVLLAVNGTPLSNNAQYTPTGTNDIIVDVSVEPPIAWRCTAYTSAAVFSLVQMGD